MPQGKTVNVELPFRPRKWQAEASKKLTHRTVLNAHRGSGKTVFCILRLIMAALSTKTESGFPARFGYIGKSINHSKQTVWDLFKYFLKGFGEHVAFNHNDLSITFPNGNNILLSGIDDAEKNRGLHFSGLILDEAQMCPIDTWEKVLGPTLRQNKGWVILIGTPNGPAGLFYEYFLKGRDGTNPYWSTLQYTIADTGEIPPEEWDEILHNYSLTSIEQEYRCNFMAAISDRVYYNFDVSPIADPKSNKPPHVQPCKDNAGTIYVGLDFNAARMDAIVAQKSKDGTALELIGELILRDATTDRMATALKRHFPRRDIVVCPDASGAAVGTAKLHGSDHDILKRHGLRVMSPKKNPRVSDRVMGVNILLENATGKRRLFVDPGCTEMIRTLTFHQKNASTGDPEKSRDVSAGLDHMGDALGYLVAALFPIRRARFVHGRLRF